MNCPKCNAEIIGEANCCSNCGQLLRNQTVFVENPPIKPKKKHKALRIILGVVIFIIGFALLKNAITNIFETGNTNPPLTQVQAKTEPTTENTTVNSRAVTLEEFNKIQTGMTYSEVCNLIGSEGTLSSQVDIGAQEYKTEIYHWYGEDGISNSVITFQNNKVIAKSQIALK